MNKDKPEIDAHDVYYALWHGDTSIFPRDVSLFRGIGEWQHNGMYLDRKGFPIERTPHSHPYSYDSFVVWKKHATGGPKGNGSIYSDRLLQWDFPKHDALTTKHFGDRGQYWRERNPKKIEAFLRDWCEDPKLVLLEIVEECNRSNGYPCWAFIFKASES